MIEKELINKLILIKQKDKSIFEKKKFTLN